MGDLRPADLALDLGLPAASDDYAPCHGALPTLPPTLSLAATRQHLGQLRTGQISEVPREVLELGLEVLITLLQAKARTAR